MDHHPKPGQIGRRTLLQGAGVAGLGLAGLGASALPAAAASYSQNGFPVITSSSSTALEAFTVRGVSFPAGVRSGNPEVILRWVARRFHDTVEPLHAGWCWGYNDKFISGSTTYSNHASGTAIDVNAPDHPRGVRGTFTAAQRTRIHAILAYCDGVVAWGGQFSTTIDAMHFEIGLKWKDPRIAALATKIKG
jgi:hypothetical protein